MNIAALMAEVGTAVASIDLPVRVYVGAPPKLDPPANGAAAIVPFPTAVRYDGTYGRGMDTATLEVYLLHPRPTDPATQERVAQYAAGAGAGSVKAALEGYAWTRCQGCRVASCDFDAVEYAEVKYMACRFEIEIWGAGGA